MPWQLRALRIIIGVDLRRRDFVIVAANSGENMVEGVGD